MAPMPRKPKAKPDDPAQSKRFKEIAREIGADARDDEFERTVRRVAKKVKVPPT